jgi:hypothetical protein
MVQVWHKVYLILEFLPPSYERGIIHAAVRESCYHRITIGTFVIPRSVDEGVQKVKVIKRIHVSAIRMLNITSCPEIHTNEELETSVFGVTE